MTPNASDTAFVFHDNGGPVLPEVNLGHVYWNSLKRRYFRDQAVAQSGRRPNNLEIIVCHNYPFKPVAVRSLEHMGIHDYRHLGGDVPADRWRNRLKLELTLDYLQNHAKSEYVLHVDAGDVLVVGSPDMILERFLNEFDCDALFNAEKFPWPCSPAQGYAAIRRALGGSKKFMFQMAKRREIFAAVTDEIAGRLERIETFERTRASTAFCHLNSGCYIGRRPFLIELFTDALALELFHPFENDDQGLVREIYRRRHPDVQIDSNGRIFRCMFLARRDEIKSAYRLGGIREEFEKVRHATKDISEWL